MKKTFKLSIILVLILTIAVAVLGCTQKTPGKTTTPGKQTEQKKPDKVETPEDKRISSLFDMREDGDSYVVTSYKGSEKEVTIPSEYRGKKVVGIESNAFRNSSIKSITIPSTVEKVDSSFGDAKIKVMDGNAKYEVIDNCLIEKATMKLISGGKYSVIPDGVKEIGNEAFCGTSIESATIPSTVEKLGERTFKDCKNLKTVTLNEGLKEIGGSAFFGTSIEEITIPSTVNEINTRFFDVKIKVKDGNAKYEAIDNCLIEKATKKLISGGKHSIIQDGIKQIGDYAFFGTSIESIRIPGTVNSIGKGAFANCKKLKTVTLNKGLKEIGSSAFFGTSVESITIPSTVEKIESLAFASCTKLKMITLNEGLKEIGGSAFFGTSIESITIPSTVEGIELSAFSYCSKLTRIDCELWKIYVDSTAKLEIQ